MEKNANIFVAGGNGMVGSAIVRALKSRGFLNLWLPSRSQLNLVDQEAVHDYFKQNKLDYVLVAAAKVGGILYNQRYQADFLYENVTIASNIIHAAYKSDVKKLLFLGSSCIYPKAAQQPITEEQLLTGPLEPTNEGYALAKIVGLKLCEKYFSQYGKRFISAMPTNLYGIGDNFHPENSHVIPGMMRRFHQAKVDEQKQVTVWGSGKPRREFLFVEDLAEALLLLMERYEEQVTINLGTGQDVTIAELANLMKKVVGFQGQILFDVSKPDGMMRKVLDVSRVNALGWCASCELEDGLKRTYDWAIKSGKL
jgi:GDP-L-fucose synthase